MLIQSRTRERQLHYSLYSVVLRCSIRDWSPMGDAKRERERDSKKEGWFIENTQQWEA